MRQPAIRTDLSRERGCADLFLVDHEIDRFHRRTSRGISRKVGPRPDSRRALDRLVFAVANGAAFHADVLNAAGDVVAAGEPQRGAVHQVVAVETGHLAPGTYFVRFAAGPRSHTERIPLSIERLPPLAGRR